MVDVVDSATRSRMMSGIRGRNTKPEILLRSALHRRGYRFRLHVRDLPGKPDIVFPGRRAVVFVHGCFWHGHDCPLFKWPQTRPEFWEQKILRNRQNDEKAVAALQAGGWRVGIVWECSLRGADKKIETVAQVVSDWLCSSEETMEHRG
ncbi:MULTISPECIES: very short patch repair endonuclease [Burkholderia]|uniref:very short patch repair endonuclease n=1 Tax=Burkholderia TaxID=32008 RepID=UPI000F5A03A9|nr:MULTISPECIES: very short patch repair endonuclease [Burkholderia]RQU51585.1 DNA mismatch endonuclease Vsr [Burkholderia cenocepacia]RQV34184.1 DNA mismatch endonuclease Vsr [Burkholderia cenocepacia]HEF5875824.1 DNA mismatch endonuclease Vsr [Burkholderia cenocepacia]